MKWNVLKLRNLHAVHFLIGKSIQIKYHFKINQIIQWNLFRYGPKTPGSIIDNCQLSDWPVRDMDKDRHLIHDSAFDVYERASYGHGCEIQPITDDKHKKCKMKPYQIV